MTFHPVFVSEGVYLRTSSGELIGRLDKPGAPFESLHEAQNEADWLDNRGAIPASATLKGVSWPERLIAVNDRNAGR